MTSATIIDTARQQGRTVLNEIEAKQLLAAAGIPVVEARLARDAGEAAKLAAEIGFPVAIKIVSPQITHKTDAGGVKLGLGSADDVRAAFDEMIASAKRAVPDAQIDTRHVDVVAELQFIE